MAQGVASQLAGQSKRVDRRVTRSRAAIVAAFERLLVEEDLDKITVSALAREANIDRKTFYVHFGTIDGLLDAIAEGFVGEVVDQVEVALGDQTLTDNPDVFSRAFFSAINRAIFNNIDVSRRVFESMPEQSLLPRIVRPLGRMILERGLVPAEVVDELFDYYLSFILSGIIAVCRTWLMSDRFIPLERVFEMADSLILTGLESLKSRRGKGAPIGSAA